MMRPDIAIAYLWATVERRACITFATSCTVGLFRRWRSARVTCVQQITLRSALLDALSAANDRIELEVDDALLERNQGVVGDLDVLGHTSVQHLVMLQKPRPCSSCAASLRLTPCSAAASSGCMSSSATRIKKRGPAKDVLFLSLIHI